MRYNEFGGALWISEPLCPINKLCLVKENALFPKRVTLSSFARLPLSASCSFEDTASSLSLFYGETARILSPGWKLLMSKDLSCSGPRNNLLDLLDLCCFKRRIKDNLLFRLMIPAIRFGMDPLSLILLQSILKSWRRRWKWIKPRSQWVWWKKPGIPVELLFH